MGLVFLLCVLHHETWRAVYSPMRGERIGDDYAYYMRFQAPLQSLRLNLRLIGYDCDQRFQGNKKGTSPEAGVDPEPQSQPEPGLYACPVLYVAPCVPCA
jgi:hypothetical protein